MPLTPPTTPSRLVPATFRQDMDTYLSWLSNTLVPALNTYSGMTNSGTFTSGSIASPGITFSGDTDTGLSNVTPGTVHVSSNGVQVAEFFNKALRFNVGAGLNAMGLGNFPIQIEGTPGFSGAGIVMKNNDASNVGPYLLMGKSRGTAAGDVTLLNVNDILAAFNFYGADGTTMRPSAAIRVITEVAGASNMKAGFRFDIGTGIAVTEAMRLDTNNVLSLVGAASELRIGGVAAANRVLVGRQTGWAAATGTATRTTFATGSVTLVVLAEHVKALIDDLITHGLIGT